MNIFDKRPLSLILCTMLGGFVIFSFGNTVVRVLLFISVFALALLPYLLHKERQKTYLLTILSLALLLSMIFSHIYFDLWFKAYERFEGEVTVEGTVSEYRTTEYSDIYRISVKSINGKPFTRYNISLRTDINEYYVKEGDRISFTTELTGFESDNGFDAQSYNFARGLNAYANGAEDLTVISNGNKPLATRLKEMRTVLTRHAIMMSDYDTGSLLAALLIGDREALSARVELDFSRIGITHILALSGSHLAILAVGINKLLSILRVNKKIRTLITLIFSFIYILFTGFSITIVRAGLMLMISSLLYLFSRSHDSVTSLAVSVFIIVIVTPYSIYDISLWLSALATLGVIVSSECFSGFKAKSTKLSSVMLKASSGLVASAFAISATMLISAMTFGGLSLISPISTILFSFLIEIIMYIGCIMLIIGYFTPIKYLVSFLCQITTSFASSLSSVKDIYVSTDYTPITVSIIILTVVFYLFIIVKLKNRRIGMYGVLIAFTAVFITSGITAFSTNEHESIIYNHDEGYDSFVIKNGSETCYVNSSQYSDSRFYTSSSILKNEKITHLDKYYITHYSWGIIGALGSMLADILIEEIVIPAPVNEDETAIYETIQTLAEEYVVKVTTFAIGDTVTVNEVDIIQLYSGAYGTTSSMNILIFRYEENVCTYLSSGILESDWSVPAFGLMSMSDTLILGSHGKSYSDNIYIEEKHEKLNQIVFAGERVFLTPESMKYYEENGCKLYLHPSRIDLLIKDD